MTAYVLGVKYPFELLDIFLEAWLAMNVLHCTEAEIVPSDDPGVPVFLRHLKTALCHPMCVLHGKKWR